MFKSLKGFLSNLGKKITGNKSTKEANKAPEKMPTFRSATLHALAQQPLNHEIFRVLLSLFYHPDRRALIPGCHERLSNKHEVRACLDRDGATHNCSFYRSRLAEPYPMFIHSNPKIKCHNCKEFYSIGEPHVCQPPPKEKYKILTDEEVAKFSHPKFNKASREFIICIQKAHRAGAEGRRAP